MYEDLFSENLIDEPADIEKVIEGDERGHFSGNESGRDDNENKSDPDEKNDIDKDKKDADKKPKIRKSIGPRVVLNAERLIGPRGIGIMESFFSDIKLHGKGKEKEDLETVMKRLELWTHRLAPRFHFDDSLKKIEKLGSKKTVQTHLKIARYGRNDDVGVARGLSEEVPDSPPASPPPVDPFDQLVASSAPSHPLDTDITAEQREQMLRNRLIAEERRAARIKKAQEMKQRFLAQHGANSSQTQSADNLSSEITCNLNPQTAEDTEHFQEQPVEKIQVEEIPVEFEPLEEANCIEDRTFHPEPLNAQNVNPQLDSSSALKFASLENGGKATETTDISNQHSNSEDNPLPVETIPDEDVDMEEKCRTSENEHVLGDQCPKLIETSSFDMDVEVQSGTG